MIRRFLKVLGQAARITCRRIANGVEMWGQHICGTEQSALHRPFTKGLTRFHVITPNVWHVNHRPNRYLKDLGDACQLLNLRRKFSRIYAFGTNSFLTRNENPIAIFKHGAFNS